MAILCIDSALGAGSVAVYRDSELLDFQPIVEKGAQVKFLISTIQQCLAKCELDFGGIETIYCTIGPGGFTGIRIALAAAQALAFTAGISIIGVSTLACMAVEAASEQPILPILPAAKGKVYAQGFNGMVPTGEACLLGTDELAQEMGLLTLANSTILGLEQLPTLSIPSMDARSVGKLVMHETFNEYHALAPQALYIRPPDAVPAKRVLL